MRYKFSVYYLISIAFLLAFGKVSTENATTEKVSSTYASETIVLQSDPAGQLLALNDSDIVKVLANATSIGARPFNILDLVRLEQIPSDLLADKYTQKTQYITHIVKSVKTSENPTEVKPEDRPSNSESKLKDEAADLKDQEDDFENISWISQVVTKSFWKFYPKSKKNNLCTIQGNLYRTNFKNMTHWAVKMFDSMSAAPGGVIETDYFNSGHFDECINIEVKPHNIVGQYCLVAVSFRPDREISPEFYIPDNKTNFNQPDPMKSVWLDIKPHTDPARKLRNQFELAVCVPKSCSYKDVETSLQEVFDNVGSAHKLALKVVVRPPDCTVKDSPITDPLGFTITLSIIGLASFLVVFGSIMDILVYRKKKTKSFLKSYLKPFSVARNMVKLKKPSSDEEFAPINGIKAVVIVAIIVGHRVMFLFGNEVNNASYMEEMIRWPPTSLITGGATVVVDTFFGITGFLTYLFLFRTLEQKKRINFLMVLFYRYLRIVPVYSIVIAIYTFIMPHFARGPRWDYLMQRDTEGCRKNWWTNLIFLNNYINENKQCMIHSWYLAVDMQLFIVTFFITVFIWKHRKYAWRIISTFLGISILLPFLTIYIKRYNAVLLTFPSFLQNVMGQPEYYDAYIKTHFRSVPYVVGIAGAHLYLKLKEKEIKFSTGQMWIGTFIVTICGFTTVLYSSLLYLADREYNLWENALFSVVHRLLWVTIPMFILIGHGTSGFGIAGRFYGSPMMLVLGRLVFCIYLIHPLIQITNLYSLRTSSYVSPLQIAWGTFGDVLFSLFGGLALNLLFESPCDRLQKKLLKRFIREFKGVEKSAADQNDGRKSVENGKSI